MPALHHRRPPPLPPFSQRLTLVSWFVRQLGYESNDEMLQNLRDVREELDEGHHPILDVVKHQKGLNISRDLLVEMDDMIHADLQKINAHRREPITLKYFQYLAALAVEYFLTRRATGPRELLKNLQTFAEHAGSRRYPAPDGIEDMNKLALWMATGAGKTLLMHLNYHQFMRWRSELFQPDNIILLTPNETLSAQHLNEMQDSGIPCFRHGQGAGSLAFGGKFPVRVLELTKLTADRSGIVTVPTSEFEGRNLVLVDEGHKGTGGEAWLARRDELAKKGFVFEYSATYGQAFKRAGAANPKEDEYAHSVVCDYSYRHFHSDGYGKDFDVVNLSGEPSEKQRDVLMLGSLLVFLQQRACFAENRTDFARHNLEPPLLLLLGATVTGGKGCTDIVDYLRFLNRTTMDGEWATDTIRKILRGETGITDPYGKDVFDGRLDWLNEQFGRPSKKSKVGDVRRVHQALLHHVFRADDAGALQFCPVSGAKGEVALRVNAGTHFGLVYVGNNAITKLCELLQEDCPEIQIFDETVTEPMFHNVASASSPVNLLIGAKKFMEGWSSWRVSGMGLLNVGRSEGPLIIQLFGRGVRLKGAGMSLKRGGGGNPAPHQELLETMNIFGIKADFISHFKDMLEREGVWNEVLHLPISEPLDKALQGGLVVPDYPPEGFTEPMMLAADEQTRVTLDISSSALHTGSTDASNDDKAAGVVHSEPRMLPSKALAMVDWNTLYRQLQDYRARAGLWNLVIRQEDLHGILIGCCTVICDADASLEPTTDDDIRRIRKTAFILLRKYADRFYNRQRSAWSRKHLSYRPIEEADLGLSGDSGVYVLSVPHKEDQESKEIVEKLRKLIDNQKELREMWKSESMTWTDPPPRVHFDQHLYQPLLIANKLQEKGIRVSPPGLNPGEVEFIQRLRSYLTENPPAADEEIYLLRNQSRTGVGIHGEAGSTFPDFILWQKKPKQQRIVFVEPHGMEHASAYQHDPKARLHETLAEINDRHLMAKALPGTTIEMESFIISQTSFDDLTKDYEDGSWDKAKFHKHHILFREKGTIPRILGDKPSNG